MSPSQMRAHLQQVNSQVMELAKETILENKEYLVALLTNQQYNEGVDSSGQPLRQYSPEYEYLKQQHGLYQGHTDLNLTGEFHAEMNVAVVDDTYIIESGARTADGELKSEWLARWNEERGGAPIMDLTPENKEVAKAYLQPLFMEKVNEVWD